MKNKYCTTIVYVVATLLTFFVISFNLMGRAWAGYSVVEGGGATPTYLPQSGYVCESSDDPFCQFDNDGTNYDNVAVAPDCFEGMEADEFCCEKGYEDTVFCPHWILVDNVIYNKVINGIGINRSIDGSFPEVNTFYPSRESYGNFDVCKNDAYVVIAGNFTQSAVRFDMDSPVPGQNPRSGGSKLIINNAVSLQAFKMRHKLFSKILSEPQDFYYYDPDTQEQRHYSSSFTLYSGLAENDGEWNFFEQKIIYDGKEQNITWGELLEIIKQGNIREEAIAAFCYSMIDDGPETNSDNTTVRAEVKNYTVGTDWSKETYAKPGDKVGWQHTYVPGAQKFYNEHCVNSSSNACKNWQNKFDIIEYDNDDENKARLIYSEGNLGNKIEEKTYPPDSSFNGYTSLSKDSVGKKITQKITSGTPIAASDSNGNITITDEGPATDSANVYVPYNFVNTISIKSGEPVLYAGEAMPLFVEIKTEGKTNTLTGVNSSNKYATVVPVAKVRSKVYIKGQESSSKTLTKTLSGGLNKGGNKNGSLESTSVSVVVDDVPAGTEYCVKVGVYPASSGSDNNWNNSNGDGQWSESQEMCVKVAKKPSLQVWGAGVYSNGKIELQDAKKKKVGGETISDGVIAFGSFAEQNIVTFGRIMNFASGAATGGPGLTDRTKTVNGEKISGSFLKTNEVTISNCVLDPLTMPNSGCGTNGSGSAVSGSGSNNVDLKAFAESFESNKSETIGTCSISLEPNLDKDKIYICNGDFAISSNIIYPKEGYTSLEEIPKVIIYAEDNINIACNVTNIDAVLITKGNVNTCSNSNNENDEIRSNQLKINGAVITGKLLANRTYGAATGKYSGIPAEIIDFDVSLYLHNAPKADANGSDKLEVVMINEMAPRY